MGSASRQWPGLCHRVPRMRSQEREHCLFVQSKAMGQIIQTKSKEKEVAQNRFSLT